MEQVSHRAAPRRQGDDQKRARTVPGFALRGEKQRQPRQRSAFAAVEERNISSAD